MQFDSSILLSYKDTLTCTHCHVVITYGLLVSYLGVYRISADS